MKAALKRIFSSSKALVMFGLTALVFFGVYRGQVTFHEALDFLKVGAPAWLLAVGLEDAAKKHGEATGKATVEAARVSLRPPPAPPEAAQPTGDPNAS